MNIFSQTAEQERHWSLMNDRTLFAQDERESKGSREFSVADIQNEIQRRLLYFRRGGGKGEKFYSLGGTAHSVQNRGHNQSDNSSSANYFVQEVEKTSFDDSQLLRVLISMQQEFLARRQGEKYPQDSLAPLLSRSEAFIGGYVEKQLNYADKLEQAMQAHAHAQLDFQRFLDLLKKKINIYAEALAEHPLFRSMDRVLEQVDAIQAICRDSKLNTSSRGYITTELPDAYHDVFPEPNHTMETDTHNVYVAKALFLHRLGLVPHIKYLFTLASLIEYVERAAEKDHSVQGVYPTIVEPDEHGLVLDVEGFAHPAIYRGKPLGKHYKDIYQSLGHGIIKLLEKDGLLGQHKDERGESDEFWHQGVTRDDVEQFIQRHALDNRHGETLMTIYQNSAFFPFSDIHLNTRNRIQIVTGANFMGKSTYMQAVGYLFHRAATARRFIATSARISLPDMVFDDFDINAHRQWDIAREQSTFSSQVRKVVEFIQRATPRSIGLFDELYHGTSAPYLLSLGWATLEKFERLGLYAVISTHEPLLTRFPEKNGLSSLRGKYYRPPHSASEDRETTVSNVSLREGYQLHHGPVIDSDAFRIARKEMMPEDVMARAHEILRHITEKNGV